MRLIAHNNTLPGPKTKIPLLMNNKITSKTGTVQLILETGESKGVIPIAEARTIAKERKMDMLQVAINFKTVPGIPICKLLDYKKHQEARLASKKKLEREKLKAKIFREVQFGIFIEPHDRKRKCKQILGYMDEMMKVKLTIIKKYKKHMSVEEKHEQAVDLLSELTKEILDSGKAVEDITKKRIAKGGTQVSTVFVPHKITSKAK